MKPMSNLCAGALLALAVLTAGCGGGGGGGTAASDGGSTRTPLAPLTEDIAPTGARLNLQASNYFPMSPGDQWTYEWVVDGTVMNQTVTRSVSTGAGSEIVLSESAQGVSDSLRYQPTAEGWLLLQPMQGLAPPTVSRQVGDILEYAEPFYAVGGTRRLIRQGDWGADLDGDGVSESFRFEYSQVLIGLETLTVANRSLADVAHFRNVISLTLQPSLSARPSVTVVTTEDAWWAPGMGLVRADRSTTDSSAAVQASAERITLTGGQVAGGALFAPQVDGSVKRIPLLHNALVFDAGRGRYLASVPGSVVGNGNSIAAIDAVTALVSYSAAVGSEPAALALSADGSALYVGLDGTGEVLKLRLPDLAVLWRARLPAASFGQLYAERLAPSPTEADVVAVSMYRKGVSPRHGGVALVRAGVLQPLMTRDHTGSNLIAFDGNGQFVYGFNNESTEFGLRRLAVLADGLREEQVTPASGNFATRSLEWANGRLLLDRTAYRTPDLATQGQVNVAGGMCHALAVPNRLVCLHTAFLGSSAEAALAVVDASSFVLQSTPVFVRGGTTFTPWDLVPGGAGQVAIRMNSGASFATPDAVWLFDSPALR